MGGFALCFVLVRPTPFSLVVRLSTTPVVRIPTGFVARVPLHWRWSSAPDIYSPGLGLVPRGVEAGRWQRITGVRGAPTGPTAVLRLTANCRLTSLFSDRACCSKYKE
ncbi:hypothetical protein K443DRAFT_673281 [Laccaria amethystina LaAM-08-1]|uniref:Secreted protein n=1 Tax=Laccaria amethystina LaAM-08-1 TaxID=1095629 RepID=A0A0C9X681_9AGAR|nr:hypothetical protein K443DRAFT_673281 [Laccaria amethystina LaAM-08-1]